MHIRKLAMNAGLKVRLETFEILGCKVSAIASRWIRDAENKKSAHRFRLAHKPRLEKEAVEVRGDEFIEGWWWVEPASPSLSELQLDSLKALLAQLPEDTLILEAGTAAVTLWWRENGTPEQVEALAGQLSELPV